ncbi:serine hydrolase domain-containing protein [Sphingobacterium sp. HJSM2_6]|uniref:serine hydrolase domain-containing protein n=1 Tax=Sphingobacterium sp. HJSM2_6 TaxID=3366264 RepID=UPI003BD79C56
MKNWTTILILLMINFVETGNAQSLNQKLDNIIKQYYPNANEPGIVLGIQSKAHQLNYTHQQGVSSVATLKPLTATSNFRMASVSKQFTAMAIYTLLVEGKIQINQPIKDFFPKLSLKVGNITIQQLLNHSSGILDYENLIPKTQKKQLMDQDVLDFINPLDSLYFEPGSKFRYSNTGYCLLALIVEMASGRSYPEYVNEVIFSPFKMHNSLLYTTKAKIKNRAYGFHPQGSQFVFADQSLTSATKGDGGVYTSANDYLKWAIGISKSGANRKLRLDIDLLRYNQFPISNAIRYSMGWFIVSDLQQNQYFVHSGESTGFHNIVLQQPDLGIYINLFSNRDDLIIAECFEAILQELEIKIQGKADLTLFDWLSRIYANNY